MAVGCQKVILLVVDFLCILMWGGKSEWVLLASGTSLWDKSYKPQEQYKSFGREGVKVLLTTQIFLKFFVVVVLGEERLGYLE